MFGEVPESLLDYGLLVGDHDLSLNLEPVGAQQFGDCRTGKIDARALKAGIADSNDGCGGHTTDCKGSITRTCFREFAKE
jgi:hypothetical protein